MKYVSEYREKKPIKELSRMIKDIMPSDTVRIMEVCGTHTHNFLRFGLDKLLPKGLKLISGPGCPVCVSSQEYIDRSIALAKLKDVIVLTYGDMIKVPGSSSSLEKEKAGGANVRVVYSALESVRFAKENPDKKVIFLAVGFETTAPTVALTILSATKEKIDNLTFFSSLKLMPEAMQYLLADHRIDIQGFLCPGHVSTIIGTRPYEFIPRKFAISCCVGGFEPFDMLQAMYMLLKHLKAKQPAVINQYKRVVKPEGNPKARRIIAKVFKPACGSWRGLGAIPQSGLKIRDEFLQFDTERIFSFKRTAPNACLSADKAQRLTQCRCADVLKGIIEPNACPFFAKACKPDNPFGPCMVSREGACNAYYRYKV